jgi:hypothetical protein
MTQRESLALYVDSMNRVKAILEEERNQGNISEWGIAIFEWIDKKDEVTTAPITELDLPAIAAAAAFAAERDMTRVRKDDIVIPV